MAFKVGQEVVCIGCDWITDSGPHKGRVGFGPSKGEILTIHSFEGNNLIFIKYGLKEAFDCDYFRPLDYDFVEEVLENVKPKEEVLL